MGTRSDIKLPFESGQAYHLFNRGINGQALFYNEGNYEFFLRKYFSYSLGYWKTYAWCLLEDHFHFLIHANSDSEIFDQGSKDLKRVDRNFLVRYEHLAKPMSPSASSDLQDFKNLADLAKQNPELSARLINWTIGERLRRLMLSYSKAINKQQNRKGSIFQKTIRRKAILI